MIRRVTEDFVPCAINLYRVRKSTNGGRELFQSIQRQKDQYQGVWIVSPEGRVLAGIQDYKDFKKGAVELLGTMDAGLQAFGPVERREAKPTNPLPFRGTGVRPDGSVDIALYGRQMLGGGRDRIPAGVEPGRAWLWDGAYRPDGPTMIDTATLSAEEWAAFAPAKAEAGAGWAVPETVARKFVRLLSSSSDQSAMPQPDEAKVAELKATVEAVEGGIARLRLAGRWEMVHVHEGNKARLSYGAATAEGIATYDVERKAMTSFLLVFDGTVRAGKPDGSPNRNGAVAEWRLGTP